MQPSPVDRAAVILSLLGNEMSEKVLTHLKPEQAERLRSRGASSSSRRLREDVLDDFDRFLRFVEEQSRDRLHLHVEEDGDGSPSQRTLAFIDPDGDPADGLRQVTESQIAGALEAEPPRATALLLSMVPPSRAAEILAHLPAERRERVVPELSREQVASPPVIDRLMRTVLQRAVTLPAAGIERVDRIQRLADVLRAVARPQRSEMLQTLTEHDPETAQAVTEKLYVFADLVSAKDRLIQQVLAEVNGSTIAAALTGAADDMREKVFSNLSRRARATLQEEMELQGQVPAAQVEAAQTEVARALARVDQEAE